MGLKCIGFSFGNSAKFISTPIYYAKNSVSHRRWPWERQNPYPNEKIMRKDSSESGSGKKELRNEFCRALRLENSAL